MARLDELPFVEKTSLFGTAVHAVLRREAVAPDQVRTSLADDGIDISSVDRVAPSLEDVFLDVVDRVDQGSAA
jgi:hypothetical protein